MRLLLTSGGIQNKLIADELDTLVGEGNRRVGFIPTAANAEPQKGDWFLGQTDNLRKFGFNDIDFIDPSAAGVDWQARLALVGIIFISGGNTFHLLNQARLTGFADWLKSNLNNFVFVGSSAGSLLATPTIKPASIENADRNLDNLKDLTGLGLVDFEFIPHAGSEFTIKSIENYAAQTKNKVYALNDSSAISINDGEFKLITEGDYWQFN